MKPVLGTSPAPTTEVTIEPTTEVTIEPTTEVTRDTGESWGTTSDNLTDLG